jgi:hypothetical protein
MNSRSLFFIQGGARHQVWANRGLASCLLPWRDRPVASIGCGRLGNVEVVRATITRSMGGRCNGQGKQPSSRDCSSETAPSSNTVSELCALRLLRRMPKRARGPSIRNWVEPEVKEAEVVDVFLSTSHLPAVACAPRWKTRAPALSPGDNVSGGASPPFSVETAFWRFQT